MTTLAWSLLILTLSASAGNPDEKGGGNLLIDDFARPAGLSTLGTQWQTFTDQVMGGVSRGSAALDTLAQTRCLRMRGQVSLENNGGFIQVALPLGSGNQRLDASGFTGILITAAGNGETYYVHLRTADTRLPWQYYQAAFPTSDKWQQIAIPFTAFQAESLRTPLDPSRIERLGIVAAKKAFVADVAIARIELYQ